MIKLRDNRFGDNALCFAKSVDSSVYSSPEDDKEGLKGQNIKKAEREVLDKFSSKSLGDLELEANGKLVILGETHVSENGRKDLPFFVFKRDEKQGDRFWLETGNLMGVLRFRDKNGPSVQVEVLSRFDKGDNNDFLNYLLSKVFDCALSTEEVEARQSSLLDILLDIVFVRRLGEAAKAGLLRHYREFRNNDWNFKGSLDLARHVRENIPLMHGIAYRKREIDLDVPVNRMILMAALTVNRRHPGFFENNPDAADALRALRMGVTETHDLRSVLSHRDCREPVRHPFFREVWEPLRRIARMILEDERWTLFSDDTEEDSVSGVVFDGSWLWEEYIATVLEPAGFRHCERGGGKGLAVFEDGNGRFYPDFLLPDATSDQRNAARVVLDTKYKRANPNGGRDDVHQVLCYLLLTGAKLGGLVFPPVDKRCESADDFDSETYGPETGGWSPVKKIASPYSEVDPIHWSCFSWAAVPNTKEWHFFKGYMASQEEQICSVAKELFANFLLDSSKKF